LEYRRKIMSKTTKLARHLEQLHINNMYKNDFYWTWDKTDEEIDAVFTVADALRDLRERNKSTRIFDSGLGISIFRDNSTRTRFSFASACNLLGLEEQVLDEKVSQIAHGETVRETANMVSFMADVVGIRDDMLSAKATSIRRHSSMHVRKATARAFSSRDPLL
jgi:ornithine carbamoyltransferase